MPSAHSNLSIAPTEDQFLAAKDLEGFWYSRLQKGDPVARIGYGLWVSSGQKFKEVIEAGPSAFWNYRGYRYWDGMARSTVVNLAVGLEKGGFRGNFLETRAKIKQVGLRVAYWHTVFVRDDYKKKLGNVPGLLSLRQMADYHHRVFTEFNIPSDFYGGTWLSSVPDQVELSLYGNLYCHDCDVPGAYRGIGQ
ncbi:hypothetical protein [Marinimicrobium locisalis]|uniref:hypothetical protein n=1 Tax=Marinimicrobium locisalis TaxID=546022 RepID=UPI00322198E2